jgi:hypothetical protein
MNQKTIFLHIGPHRTGSTYLQEVFFNNREIFRSASLFYEVLAESPPFNHNCIFDFGLNNELLIKLKEKFAKSKSDSMLISSESIFSINPRYIASVFENYRLIPIFCIRDPIDIFKSTWSISVSNGGYTGNLQDLADSDYLLRYASYIRMWHTICGENFKVFYFDSKADPNKLFKAFLEVLISFGLALDIKQFSLPNDLINIGLTIEKTTVLQALLQISIDLEVREVMTEDDLWFIKNYLRFSPDLKYAEYDHSPDNLVALNKYKNLRSNIIREFNVITQKDVSQFLNNDISDIKFYKINHAHKDALTDLLSFLLRLAPIPPGFNERKYFENNQDVMGANQINALNHWRLFGWREQRKY